MAKKAPTKKRKAPKPGLLAIGGVAAAVAEVTGGGFLKNQLTDAIRVAVKKFFPGQDKVVIAAIIIVVTQLVHIETNKMGINPDLKFVRAF